ncbi:hypothetical protein MED193_04102 [Roseobacter sp. MED193]|nr:hypothetical protein MED193_04102 [Roseobacter sp. MED193]
MILGVIPPVETVVSPPVVNLFSVLDPFFLQSVGIGFFSAPLVFQLINF